MDWWEEQGGGGDLAPSPQREDNVKLATLLEELRGLEGVRALQVVFLLLHFIHRVEDHGGTGDWASWMHRLLLRGWHAISTCNNVQAPYGNNSLTPQRHAPGMVSKEKQHPARLASWPAAPAGWQASGGGARQAKGKGDKKKRKG